MYTDLKLLVLDAQLKVMFLDTQLLLSAEQGVKVCSE